VRPVNSNRTGRPVFRWTIFPLAWTVSPLAMWQTRRLRRSQARSLLSIARLKRTRFRGLPAASNRIRIDQTCCRVSGAFLPTSLPLFQGTWGICGMCILRLLLSVVRASKDVVQWFAECSQRTPSGSYILGFRRLQMTQSRSWPESDL